MKTLTLVLWFIMSLAIGITIASILNSCGDDQDRQKSCVHGCPTDQNVPNDPIVVPIAGPAGPVGQDGVSCQVLRDEVATMIKCGEYAYYVYDGKDGSRGTDGINGTDGTAGTDGKDGTNGKNGVDATPVQSVALCGSTQPHAEIAIKVSGSWIAYFENGDGSNRRLTALIPGQYYRSTDGFQTCTFTTSDLDAML